MKKAISVFLCISLLISGFCISGVFASEKNPDSYYSEANAPVFYGAVEITVPLGVIVSPDDARFRVFATDFEDDDLTQDIICTGSVDCNSAGDYAFNYKVTDSHKNTSVLTVPVHVVSGIEKITVKRTLYTLPSTWNIEACGFVRGAGGDRQILGIFLPAGKSVEIKTGDVLGNKVLSFYGNDSATESSYTVTKGGDWVTLKNSVRNNSTGLSTDYPSVPLIKTSMTAKGVKPGVTETIEIRYDADTPELNLYHIGDDEKAFRDKWNTEKNTFGIMECSAALFIVPYDDLQYSVGYYGVVDKANYGFESLDDFLGYFIKFTAKMDEYIGLELNPEDPVNQNVRTKYTVKANAHGGGAAYYGTDNVGVHSSSIRAIFSYGWGTLHEFAHGYQGNFGKANGYMGEVSNNILGHYIQIDKDIYKAPGDWLGSYAKIENNVNKARETSGISADYTSRLYFICRLLDCFEGAKTYQKMFTYYRTEANKGVYLDTFDVYALTIAEEYGVNILPYLSDWGITCSSGVQDSIIKKELPSLNILGATVNDTELAQISITEDYTEKYIPVLDTVLEKYSVKGNLYISTNAEISELIDGKQVTLIGKEANYYTVVKGGKAVFENLPVGSYKLVMPSVKGYENSTGNAISIKSGKNEIVCDYEKVSANEYCSQELRVQGNNGTFGFKMLLNGTSDGAVISLTGAGMVLGTYVKIYDDNGGLIKEYAATEGPKSNLYFFSLTNKSEEISVAPGYKIEVNNTGRGKTLVNNNASGNDINDLTASSALAYYYVTPYGFRLSTQTEDDAKAITYSQIKAAFNGLITDYENNTTESERNDRYARLEEKNKIIGIYGLLNNQDQSEYAEFTDGIINGSKAPTVRGKTERSFPYGQKVNVYNLIRAYDFDGTEIECNSENVKVGGNFDSTKLGTYTVEYTVKGKEKTANYTVTVTIYETQHSLQPIVAEKAPTCTEDGMTGGSYCTVCGQVIEEWQVLPATGHVDTDKDGVCDNCGESYYDELSWWARFWKKIMDFFRRIFGILQK